MDIKQLEFFVTACERGSLSQAAICLYTSQPNVSKTIRSLERELGRPLLERSGKGVSPTVYGETRSGICKNDTESNGDHFLSSGSGYEKQYPDFHLSKQYDRKASDRFL